MIMCKVKVRVVRLFGGWWTYLRVFFFTYFRYGQTPSACINCILGRFEFRLLPTSTPRCTGRLKVLGGRGPAPPVPPRSSPERFVGSLSLRFVFLLSRFHCECSPVKRRLIMPAGYRTCDRLRLPNLPHQITKNQLGRTRFLQLVIAPALFIGQFDSGNETSSSNFWLGWMQGLNLLKFGYFCFLL